MCPGRAFAPAAAASTHAPVEIFTVPALQVRNACCKALLSRQKLAASSRRRYLHGAPFPRRGANSSAPVAARADDVEDAVAGVHGDGVVAHRLGEAGNLRGDLALRGRGGSGFRGSTIGGRRERILEFGVAVAGEALHLGSEEHEERCGLGRVRGLEEELRGGGGRGEARGAKGQWCWEG